MRNAKNSLWEETSRVVLVRAEKHMVANPDVRVTSLEQAGVQTKTEDCDCFPILHGDPMFRKSFCIAVLVSSLILSIPSLAQDSPASVGATHPELHAVHVFDEKVTIGGLLNIGKSKFGERRLIPITGGTFKGPDIEGVVVPGGADWQLTRPDGDTELNARYTLKTNDGFLIQVVNHVLLHTPKNKDDKAGPYARSVLDFEAPSDSPYDWLNHSIFLGTLTIPQPVPKDNPYVVIGVYRLR